MINLVMQANNKASVVAEALVASVAWMIFLICSSVVVEEEIQMHHNKEQTYNIRWN